MEVQGTIDCALRLGLPCYEDLNQQADGRTTLGTHNFSNMNISGRSYSNHEAIKDDEMQNGEGNADVTLGLWSPSTRVQINNENICTSYVEVPPSGFNCLESPSFHSDSVNHQTPVIPTRGRPKKKKMKKANDSKHCCGTCGKKKTPLWRKGPDGPQTLCNACGLRYSRATKRDEKTLEPHQLNLNLPPEELGDETQEDISF